MLAKTIGIALQILLHGVVDIDNDAIVRRYAYRQTHVVQRQLDAQICLRRLSGLLERLLDAVHGFIDACFLPWQTLHGDVHLAGGVVRNQVHHTQCQSDGGLRQLVDVTRHDFIGTSEARQRNAVIHHAGLHLAGHLVLRGLEMCQYGLHAAHRPHQITDLVQAIRGQVIHELTLRNILGHLAHARHGLDDEPPNQPQPQPRNQEDDHNGSAPEVVAQRADFLGVLIDIRATGNYPIPILDVGESHYLLSGGCFSKFLVQPGVANGSLLLFQNFLDELAAR